MISKNSYHIFIYLEKKNKNEYIYIYIEREREREREYRTLLNILKKENNNKKALVSDFLGLTMDSQQN